MYLASISAAGARKRDAVSTAPGGTGAALAGPDDETQEAAQGSERVVRLGGVGTATTSTTAAFYAMPSAVFAHSARHNLTKVEVARVKKSKEKLKLAQLERARDEKAAKAAGVPLHVPSREEAAELAAWHVVQQTKGIETAPRLARLEDLLTSWPLVHGLHPPAPIGNAQTDSRFIIASGVPESATTAEMQEACAAAFRSAIVSCEPWPSAPSSWCIGLWSARRASRALKTSLVVHGQPITLSACPCQDVPNKFELSGLVSLTAPGAQGDAQPAADGGDRQYCPNCGEQELDATGVCHACRIGIAGDMEECPNCGEPEYDPSEQICYACEYSREDY